MLSHLPQVAQRVSGVPLKPELPEPFLSLLCGMLGHRSQAFTGTLVIAQGR